MSSYGIISKNPSTNLILTLDSHLQNGPPNSFGYESRGSLQAHPETLVPMPAYMRCNGKRRQPSAAPELSVSTAPKSRSVQ